jgi:predicted thioesterase
MKEEDEEGIGTFVSVKHLKPAKVGEEVIFEAMVKAVESNRILCTYIASVQGQLIAEGEQEQKILKKDNLRGILGV